MAVPFYTRLWEEQTVEGEVKVSSKALKMEQAENVLSSRNITPEWQEETGQNYAEYVENGMTYKIWLEDEDSMKKRLEAILTGDIAGIAAWQLGFETQAIWPLIKQYVK